MTIDEAIEELNRGTRQNRSTNNQRLREALQLGIEALKYLQDFRKGSFQSVMDLLPGETKDCQEHQPTPSDSPHSPLTFGRAWAEARASLKK